MGIFDKKQKQAQGDQIKPQKNEGAQSVPPALVGEKLSLEGDMINLESRIIEYNVRLERIEQKVHQGNYFDGSLYLNANGHLYEELNKSVAQASDKLESRRKRYIEVFGQEAYEKAKKECLERAIKEASWYLKIMGQKPLKELSEYAYKESQNNHVVLYKEEKRKKQIELEDSPLQDNHVELYSKELDKKAEREREKRLAFWRTNIKDRYTGHINQTDLACFAEGLYQQNQIIELLQEQNQLLKQQISLLQQQKPTQKKQPKQQQEKGMGE